MYEKRLSIIGKTFLVFHKKTTVISSVYELYLIALYQSKTATYFRSGLINMFLQHLILVVLDTTQNKLWQLQKCNLQKFEQTCTCNIVIRVVGFPREGYILKYGSEEKGSSTL